MLSEDWNIIRDVSFQGDTSGSTGQESLDHKGRRGTGKRRTCARLQKEEAQDAGTVLEGSMETKR